MKLKVMCRRLHWQSWIAKKLPQVEKLSWSKCRQRGMGWTGRTSTSTSHLLTWQDSSRENDNVKSVIISWKVTMQWTLERRLWRMGLKAMHEEKKNEQMQKNMQDVSLIEQQSQKITELMKEKEQDSSLIKQLRNQLQTLSSNNSTLKSELQKKSEMIVSLNEKLTKQNGNDTVLQENRQLKEENKRLEKEADEAKSMIEAMKWTSDHAEDEIKRQVREQVKNAEEQASANLQQQENVLKANFKREQIKLDKSYAEKEKTLEMAYRGSKRLMWILKAVVAVAVFLIVLAVCINSQNKAIKKAAQLQECIDEVNTANWYLCGKDMIVYTRVEEFYIPMDRMTLRSGRAVQVIQIGEEWVEIRSQGKVGYIRNSEFKQHFSKISIEIG